MTEFEQAIVESLDSYFEGHRPYFLPPDERLACSCREWEAAGIGMYEDQAAWRKHLLAGVAPDVAAAIEAASRQTLENMLSGDKFADPNLAQRKTIEAALNALRGARP